MEGSVTRWHQLVIERGMTAIELATVTGHRDSRTTERIYIHLFNRAKMEDRVRQAMQSAMELCGHCGAAPYDSPRR